MRIRPCFPDLREGTSVSVLLSLSVVAVLSPDSLKGSGSVEALLWVNAKVLISGALRLQVNIRVSLSVSVKSPAGVLVGMMKLQRTDNWTLPESPYPRTCI